VRRRGVTFEGLFHPAGAHRRLPDNTARRRIAVEALREDIRGVRTRDFFRTRLLNAERPPWAAARAVLPGPIAAPSTGAATRRPLSHLIGTINATTGRKP
jgi:hypothetical protein